MNPIVQHRFPSPEIEAAASRWIARRDAGMTAAEGDEMQRWIAADPRHAQALARHEQAWALFDRPVATGNAKTMLRELGARVSRRRRRRRFSAALASTAALLFVGFALHLVVKQSDRVLDPADSKTSAVLRPHTRMLPDGSIIELKSDAAIMVDYSGTDRRITLQNGQAHFQVISDTNRPFVVVAEGVEIRAVGTAFSVHLEGREVDILVTEGRVAVEAPSSAQGKEPQAKREESSALATPSARRVTTLGAGERAIINLESLVLQVSTMASVDRAERLAWRGVRLEFTATPLAEAVALMNRYSSARDHLQLMVDPDDAELARLEVSGYFRAENSETFLRLIEQTLGIHAERRGDTIVLRRVSRLQVRN